MLTALDLCSGVGAGFPLAAQRKNIKIVGLCDRSNFCQEILYRRYPNIPIYPLVERFQDYDQTRPDIITTSPPCQPFSVQGKREGCQDKRDCIPYILTAIARTRPRYFAIENVPGLLSCPLVPGTAKGSYFIHLLRFLQASGYDAEWICVSSGHFGAPFIRYRLLMVGVARSVKPQWNRTTPWAEQVRSTIERARTASQEYRDQSRLARTSDGATNGVYVPLGIQSGDGITRERRAALGNALDPRVAAIALDRILYLNNLFTLPPHDTDSEFLAVA